ncbi:MAG: vWA domain-containing protein [Candidatus Woykebacteria bacterium]
MINKLKKPVYASLIIALLISQFGLSYPNKAMAQIQNPIKDPPIPPSARHGQQVKVPIYIPKETLDIRQKADTMLVMDLSGSMAEPWGSGTKYDAAKQALHAFINQTEWDAPAGGTVEEWDKVGLTSYQNVNGTCNNGSGVNILNCARVESSSGNNALLDAFKAMNSPGKINLNGDINSMLAPNGVTPIGAGLELANRQILHYGRSNVPKYVVLATDGLQNRWPSVFSPIDPGIPGVSFGGGPGGPGDPTPLQKAITNNIRIITVGIGSDSTGSFDPGGCVDCPASITTGIQYMKYVACITDPDCRSVPPDSNPYTNDPNSPFNFFFAPDNSDLETLYEQIQNRIRSDYDPILIDRLNVNVFETIPGFNVVQIDDWEVWKLEDQIYGCGAGGNNVNASGLFNDTSTDITVPGTIIKNFNFFGQRGIFVNFGVPLESNYNYFCILLTVTVNDTVLPRNTPPYDVDLGGIVGYLLPNGTVEPDQVFELNKGAITILADYDPWIKTTDGTVGVLDRTLATARIDMNRSSPPEDNASYLTLVDGGINNFTSAKDWLVGGYPFNSTAANSPNSDSLEGSADIYATLKNKYEAREIGALTGPGPCIYCIRDSRIDNAAGISSSKILLFNPGGALSPLIDNKIDYHGDSAVIFVNGDLRIEKDVEVDSDKGLVFIVNGNILVEDDDVKTLDGVYISNGVFNSHAGDERLTINGSVLAFGGFNLQRNLNSDNFDRPSERFLFEPKYLWLFRNILGDSNVLFEELPP